jgi:dienelactone hydrolase
MRRRGVLAALSVVAASVALHSACEYARGAALVVRVSGIRGLPATLADLNNRQVSTRQIQLPGRLGPLRARLYVPDGAIRRALVLVPGVHGGGIDEPRLVGFARTLAADGVAVLTPELIDLMQYQVTPRSTDMIEDAVAWATRQKDLAAGGRVGLMGISFGGGLSLVAAGRAAIRDRIEYVVSFGGYGDFERVLRYLCTGILPDGSRFPQHDYGVAIILLGATDRLVPAAQVPGLRAAILTFLNASHVVMIDRAKGEAEFGRARALAASLAEPAATYMRWVNARDVKALGKKLLPLVSALASHPSLSPERSPAPAVPVFLLHGADDNVIPAAESIRLAEQLRPKTRVELLVTPLITHAEIDRPASWGDMWKLVSFWTAVLR